MVSTRLRNKPPPTRLGAALLCACLAASAPSSAAEPAVPSAADVERARALFETGAKAADAGRWAEAHKAFSDAWKLKQHPQIAANLGRAAFHLGKPGQAAEFLSRFLREEATIEPADRKTTETMLAQAVTNTTLLTVSVSVTGALVLLDGLPVGTSPLPRSLYTDIGPHEVVAITRSGAEARRTVEAFRGVENRADLVLPVAAPVAPPKPRVGEDDLESGPSPVLVGIGAGAAGVGLAFAIVATVVSSSAASELDAIEVRRANRTPPEPTAAEWDPVNERRVNWARLAEAGYITAGVAALATVGYVAISGTADKPDAGSGGTARVALGPGQAAFVLVQPW